MGVTLVQAAQKQGLVAILLTPVALYRVDVNLSRDLLDKLAQISVHRAALRAHLDREAMRRQQESSSLQRLLGTMRVCIDRM